MHVSGKSSRWIDRKWSFCPAQIRWKLESDMTIVEKWYGWQQKKTAGLLSYPGNPVEWIE